VCGRVIVRVRGRERWVRRKEWGVLDKECVVGDGYIAKISSKEIYKNTPNLTIKFRGVTSIDRDISYIGLVNWGDLVVLPTNPKYCLLLRKK
jgi:hypothetical protein